MALIEQRSKINNIMASSGPNAQGKGIKRTVLTGSLLRSCYASLLRHQLDLQIAADGLRISLKCSD
jgi:hypothetical protein